MNIKLTYDEARQLIAGHLSKAFGESISFMELTITYPTGLGMPGIMDKTHGEINPSEETHFKPNNPPKPVDIESTFPYAPSKPLYAKPHRKVFIRKIFKGDGYEICETPNGSKIAGSFDSSDNAIKWLQETPGPWDIISVE